MRLRCCWQTKPPGVVQGIFHRVLDTPDVQKACTEALMPLRYRRAQCSGVWHNAMDAVYTMAPIYQVCLLSPAHITPGSGCLADCLESCQKG